MNNKIFNLELQGIQIASLIETKKGRMLSSYHEEDNIKRRKLMYQRITL